MKDEAAKDPENSETPPRPGDEPIEVEAEPAGADDAQGAYEPPPDNPFRGPEPPPARAGGPTGWAVACHLVGLLDFGVSIACAGLIATATLWLVKRGEDPEVDFHGKESLNFQLNLLFWQLVALVLCFCLIGIPFLAISPLVKIGGLIWAAVRASEGERWRYPWVYRVIQ